MTRIEEFTMLSGLGAAWYLHKGLQKRASEAKESLEYLKDKGVIASSAKQEDADVQDN